MKRKWWILIVGLAALAVVLWQAAPLWQKPGVEPQPLLTVGPQGPVPLIIDDDGSPDGSMALMYFLRNPMFDIRAVTVSYGEAHPEVFAQNLAKLLADFGRAGIPIGYGRDAPLEGDNAFPDSWRQGSNNFWGLSIPAGGSPVAAVPAAELIVQTVSASDRPVRLVVTGSQTNLAEALQLDPGITANIRDVFIMGGSLNRPGNIHSAWPVNPNETAEWNIWVDPLAANQVFSSGLDLHLVPLDATDDVIWTKADQQDWETSEAPESRMAAALLRGVLGNGRKGALVWDLVTAVQATDPALCPEKRLGITILTEPGGEQGRTKLVDQPPNVSVCFDPDPEKVRALAAAVFKLP